MGIRPIDAQHADFARSKKNQFLLNCASSAIGVLLALSALVRWHTVGQAPSAIEFAAAGGCTLLAMGAAVVLGMMA